jgi:hypothetical protein
MLFHVLNNRDGPKSREKDIRTYNSCVYEGGNK